MSTPQEPGSDDWRPMPVVVPRRGPLLMPRRPALNAPPDPPTEYWVHWHYSFDEWQEWLLAKREQIRRQTAEQQQLIGGVGAILFAAVAIVSLFGGMRAIGWALIAGLFTVGAVFLWRRAAASAAIVARKWYERQPQGPHEIAIGPRWIWEPERVTPVVRLRGSRLWVRLGQRPLPHVRLMIEEQEWYSRSTVTREIEVPVPRGCEAAAQQLVERFRVTAAALYRSDPPATPPTAPTDSTHPAPPGADSATRPLPPLPPRLMDPETQALRER